MGGLDSGLDHCQLGTVRIGVRGGDINPPVSGLRNAYVSLIYLILLIYLFLVTGSSASCPLCQADLQRAPGLPRSAVLVLCPW